ACPYHARYFNWWDPVWPDGMEKSLSPNVSARMRGVVEKCSFCYHRRQLALEKAHVEGRRELEEDEYQTSCAEACPAGAITFGDLYNPEHAVAKLAQPDHHHSGRPQNPDVFRLLEELGTNPKVYYMTTRKWVREMGDHYFGKKIGKSTAAHH
ncbi:MAG: 4Fe-4S dicluster domain-containing protein, partial [Desulfobacterales bacterium]|nr:4Fe-4S dicluster domain-containing protein [Desulfobacterales bacterium]